MLLGLMILGMIAGAGSAIIGLLFGASILTALMYYAMVGTGFVLMSVLVLPIYQTYFKSRERVASRSSFDVAGE